LHIRDVEVFDEYRLVHFYWTKTIQFRERELICPLVKLNDEKLCPVAAFKNVMYLKFRNKFGAIFLHWMVV